MVVGKEEKTGLSHSEKPRFIREGGLPAAFFYLYKAGLRLRDVNKRSLQQVKGHIGLFRS